MINFILKQLTNNIKDFFYGINIHKYLNITIIKI
jgi:hypothetical protein